MTSCPYCQRTDGHYLGCRELNETSTFRLLMWALAGMGLLIAVLALVVVIFGG